MLDCFPSLRPTDGFIDALVSAAEPHNLRAVVEACARFSRGQVTGHNNAWPPSAPEFAQHVAFLDGIYKTTDDSRPLLNGLVEIDFGHGRINMRGLSAEEQEQIIRHKGIAPDGRNMALMTIGELLDTLAGEQVHAIDYDARREHVQKLLAGAFKAD